MLIAHLPSVEEDFKYFISPCVSVADLENNAKIINEAIMSVFESSKYTISISKIVKGEAIMDIMLLLVFLYQTLPSFIPKSNIEFHGGLHDQIIRHIEIFNPSNTTLHYSSKLEGSPEFELLEQKDQKFALSPKSQMKVPLQFLSRFSKPAYGRLSLYSKNMGLNNASILVFNLTGTVEPPVPRKIFKVDSPMYSSPPLVVELEISNPLPKKGNFKVTLRQTRVYLNF